MTDFLFVANDSSLDFVNTEVILDGVRTELLQNFSDFAEWLEKAGIASTGNAHRLREEWADTPETNRSLQTARELRSQLRTSVENIVNSGRLPGSLAGALNRHLKYPRLADEVIPAKGRLQIQSRWLLEKPADLVVPVAHLAANFFSSADYSAIRKCENPDCILFFYDTSKNHSRRWCSMGLCGNRAKVAAFRKRN